MSISPTGYEYGMTPRGNHPFWDNTGDITGVTASVVVDDTSGVPDAEVDAEYDEGVVNLAFSFTGLKGAKGDKGDTGAQGATGATGAKGDTGSTPNVTATATVDSTSGTPAVEVTKTGTTDNPVLNFAFSNLKGDAGTDGSTPNVTATASVDGTSGTPAVNVTKSGTDSAPVFNFAFEGLKGTKGNTGDTPNVTATASVDNNTGTPSVSVTTTGTTDNPVLNFAFSNLKGATGAQGAQGVKGETGDTGAQGAQGLTGATPVISATASVDNTSGTPAVAVTKSGTDEAPNLNFAFTGLKGAGAVNATIHGYWIDPDTQEPIYTKSGALTLLEIGKTNLSDNKYFINETIADGSQQQETICTLPWWSDYSDVYAIPQLEKDSNNTMHIYWKTIHSAIMRGVNTPTASELYKILNGSSINELSFTLDASQAALNETGLSIIGLKLDSTGNTDIVESVSNAFANITSISCVAKSPTYLGLSQYGGAIMTASNAKLSNCHVAKIGSTYINVSPVEIVDMSFNLDHTNAVVTNVTFTLLQRKQIENIAVMATSVTSPFIPSQEDSFTVTLPVSALTNIYARF